MPTTRVEKVDDIPSHGQVPGTAAFDMRTQDAVPDEIEIVPEGTASRRLSRAGSPSRAISPGGTPIPKTTVEKVDPNSPSHGEIPGTAAYDQRKADAAPDAIYSAPEAGSKSPSITPEVPIPATVITKTDDKPSHGEVPGTAAYDIRQADAAPDEVRHEGDIPGKEETSCLDFMEPLTGSVSPTSSSRSSHRSHTRRRSIDSHQSEGKDGGPTSKDDENGGFGDDFDDFEEGAGDADDDFGDFGDDFEEPEPEHEQPPAASTSPYNPPLPSFVSSERPKKASQLHVQFLFCQL